jgi:hypothetical protein
MKAAKKKLTTTAAMLTLPPSIFEFVDAHVAARRQSILRERNQPHQLDSIHFKQAESIAREQGVGAANRYLRTAARDMSREEPSLPTRASVLRELVQLGLEEFKRQQNKSATA